MPFKMWNQSIRMHKLAQQHIVVDRLALVTHAGVSKKATLTRASILTWVDRASLINVTVPAADIMSSFVMRDCTVSYCTMVAATISCSCSCVTHYTEHQ